jgi:hypothetical protein
MAATPSPTPQWVTYIALRPRSLSRLEVVAFSGFLQDAVPAGSLATPEPIVEPSPYGSAAAHAVDISVRTGDGRLVRLQTSIRVACDAMGSLCLDVTLRPALAPNRRPYVISARLHGTHYVGTADLLVSPIPPDGGSHLGDLEISTNEETGYQPGTSFRVTKILRYPGFRRRTLTAAASGWIFETDHDVDFSGVVPAVNDMDVQRLRVRFDGVPVAAPHFQFNCVDAYGARARVELLPGKVARVDTIFRAAHALLWLPNDPRRAIPLYSCQIACAEGTWVDSPLVVSFALQPSDVRVVGDFPILRLSHFNGRCVRGYTMLQDERQFTDVFSLAERGRS